MKNFMCAAMMTMVGCGIVPQERLEPVGGTRDLVSSAYRLYARESAAKGYYCVLVESKSYKSTELLTRRGALSEKQLKKLLRNITHLEAVVMFFTDAVLTEQSLREDRLAALQVRDAHLALTTERFNAIVARLSSAKPQPEIPSSSCDKFASVAN